MEGIELGSDLDLPILPLFCQLNLKVDESNEWKETSRLDTGQVFSFKPAQCSLFGGMAIGQES